MAWSSLQGLGRYDMSGKREALMLCVKQGNAGASGDLQIMENFFADFGFTFTPVIDKSVQAMRRELTAFRDRINSSPEDISCVFVVTSSHGHRNKIVDARGDALAVEEIIKPFDDRQCPKLKGKPKVFMLDACRGSLEDPGVSVSFAQDRQLQAYLNRQMAKEGHHDYMKKFHSPWIHDMFVVYPAMPDYVAWMTSRGANMFVKMAEVLQSADTVTDHLHDLFVKVNQKMVDDNVHTADGTRKSVLIIEQNLTKAIYLGRPRRSSFKQMDPSFFLLDMPEFFQPTLFWPF